MGYTREDIGRGYVGPPPRESEEGTWLDSNEFPWTNPVDDAGLLRLYSEPRPPRLTEAFARYLGVPVERLLITRGGDEAIELSTRICALPGEGRVVVSSPTFAMYAINARLMGREVVDVPQVRDGDRFRLDVDGIVAALDGASLVCLCNPGNPTGQPLDDADIRAVLDATVGRCLVLVDEAYAEFTGRESALRWLDEYDNILVLRTLSKAHALAGARCGALVGPVDVMPVASAAQTPYPFGRLDAEAALRALDDAVVATTLERVELVCAERERVSAALADSGLAVLPASVTNFLVVESFPADAFPALARAGISVRRVGPPFVDGVRITIGTPEQNDALLACLVPA